MSKDPNYNRHAGIVTLYSPLYPNQRRPIRVDEDGIEIYADDELERISQLGKDQPVRVAEAPNPNWNGSEIMHGQGQRDGKNLDAFVNPPQNLASIPPSNGIYSLPAGGTAWIGDPTNRIMRDKSGNLVINPDFQKVIDNTDIDKVGVAIDLGTVAGGTAWALKKGAMKLGAAMMLPATRGAKQAYDLEKERKAREGRK